MAAALSLQCDICGAQLRSVAEAQAHGDPRRHTSLPAMVAARAPQPPQQCR